MAPAPTIFHADTYCSYTSIFLQMTENLVVLGLSRYLRPFSLNFVLLVCLVLSSSQLSSLSRYFLFCFLVNQSHYGIENWINQLIWWLHGNLQLRPGSFNEIDLRTQIQLVHLSMLASTLSNIKHFWWNWILLSYQVQVSLLLFSHPSENILNVPYFSFCFLTEQKVLKQTSYALAAFTCPNTMLKPWFVQWAAIPWFTHPSHKTLETNKPHRRNKEYCPCMLKIILHDLVTMA